MPSNHNYSLRARRSDQGFLFYREDPLPKETKKRPICRLKSWATPLSLRRTIEWFTSEIKPKRKPTTKTARMRIVDYFISECLPAKYKTKSHLDTLSLLVGTLNVIGTAPVDTIYDWLETCAGTSDIGAQCYWILSKALPKIPKSWNTSQHLHFIPRVLWGCISHELRDPKNRKPEYFLKSFELLCVFLEKRFRHRTISNPPPLYAFRIMHSISRFLYRNHSELLKFDGFLVANLIDIAKKRKLRDIEIILREFPLRDRYEGLKEPRRLETQAFAVLKNTYSANEILNDKILNLAVPDLVDEYRQFNDDTYQEPCFLVENHKAMCMAAVRKYVARGYVYSGWDSDHRFVRRATRPAIVPAW